MQILRTLPQNSSKTTGAGGANPSPREEAPVEISVQDVVYIRRDAADCEPKKEFDLGRALKIGSSALIGGACGAVPVAGAVTNLVAGTHEKGSDSVGMASVGGGVLNLASSIAWGITGQPAFMAAPALAGAIGWGMRAAETT